MIFGKTVNLGIFFDIIKKRKFLIMLLFLVAGLALRLAMIGQTDLTEDEAYVVSFAYKVAAVLWNFPIFAIFCIAIAALFIYLVLVRRSLISAVIFSAALLGAFFLLGMPQLTYTHGSAYIFFTAIIIFLTNLPPHIAGPLLSTIAALLLAFVGYFFGKEVADENLGIIICCLILISPYNVFMSTSAFIGTVAMALMFLSLLLFIKSRASPKLLPFSSLFFVLSFSTRYTALIMLPVFAALFFFGRKEFLDEKSRKESLIFCLIVLSALLVSAPPILNTIGFTTVSPAQAALETRNDLTDIHYSSFIAETIGGTARSPSPLFFINAISLFYSPILLLLFSAGMLWAIKRKDKILLIMLFIFFSYFIYYSFINVYQRTTYLMEMEFPLLVVSSAFLYSIKIGKISKLILLILAAFFIIQSSNIVLSHHFSGFSEIMQKIPADKVVFANLNTPVYYYRGTYLYNTNVSKPFFNKFFPEDQEKEALFREKMKLNASNYDDLNTTPVDYAVVTEDFFKYPQSRELEKFKRCSDIKQGSATVFRVYAKSGCPN